MLQLKNVTKDYVVSDQTVHALRGINLSFRKSEFVSILGPSGCGKTTLLNIIGGLDRYTSGDIVINGTSTKLYGDGDWDAYRNHSIGFVFQSYNLIPHQTVLANVELALTLSGVQKQERRKRAEQALEKVGLKDQTNKLPAQLSGGQMQRVAIARAIVNDPEIILADEPTGALDTATSVQVMDILKQLAKDKLVVMVTHNPELAKQYSTRIIKLKDGVVNDDSNPFEYTDAQKNREQDEQRLLEKNRGKNKKPSMSLKTALSLSLNNLGTKKARTALTSFAGSIGIIGIALILSLSAGFNGYVTSAQRNVLSNYPVSISQSSLNMTSYATAFMGQMSDSQGEKYPDSGVVTSNDAIGGMLNSFTDTYNANDLKEFKKYLDEADLVNAYPDKISAVYYSYNYDINLYNRYSESAETSSAGTSGAGGSSTSGAASPSGKKDERLRKINAIASLETYIGEYATKPYFKDYAEAYYNNFKMMMDSTGTWGKLLDNDSLIKSQYDLIAGKWPSYSAPKQGEPWQLLVVVDEYNRLPDYSMYFMGLISDENVSYLFSKMIYTVLERVMGSAEFNAQEQLDKTFGENYSYSTEFKLDELVGKKYSALLNGQYYVKDGKTPSIKLDGEDALDGKPHEIFRYVSRENDEEFLTELLKKQSTDLEICGVVRLKEGVTGGALSKNIYYTPAFSDYLIDKTNELEVVKAQKEAVNVAEYRDGSQKVTLSYDLLGADEDKDGNPTGALLLLNSPESALTSTYKLLGMADKSDPTGIAIYPTSFENKDFIVNLINDYNVGKEESKQIKYTDYIGMMMSSISTIINAITYVLIAFVSVSLVVSSIMIGVITYISVLERTKEIGILRSIGASKRDIRRVFNAETVIIGFISGALGIVITVLLDIPISILINSLAGIPNVAALPAAGGIILVVISVVLTLIAGLIPSGYASKKDPVIALRSE